jgi:hypothetical protein
MEKVVRLWRPPTPWYESPAIVAVASVIVASVLTYFAQRESKKDETTLALRKAGLEQAQAARSTVDELVANLLVAAYDRTAMAQGKYDDLDTAYLREIRDSADGADRRWRIGRHTAEGALQFYFGGDTAVLSAWDSMRARMQRYADCAEHTYRRYLTSMAPESACAAVRDTATKSVRRLNDLLLYVYTRRGEM